MRHLPLFTAAVRCAFRRSPGVHHETVKSYYLSLLSMDVLKAAPAGTQGALRCFLQCYIS